MGHTFKLHIQVKKILEKYVDAQIPDKNNSSGDYW